MNAESAAPVLWQTPRRALFTLVFAGLLVVPRLCPAGHAWKATDSETYTCLHCKHYTVAEDDDEEEEDEGRDKRKFCNKKKSWRVPGSFAFDCPSNLTCRQFMKVLYWFGEKVSVGMVAGQAGAPVKTVRAISYMLRCLMSVKIAETQRADPMLGGPGK
eukprot:9042224-Alexandrium_andersonii.AAC.1